MSFEVAQSFHAKGMYEESIPHILDGLKQAPTDAPGWTLLGSSLASVGRIDEGIAALARACTYDSLYPQAYCVMGGALIHAGRHLEAKPYLERALQIAPGFAKAAWNLAQVELMLENWERAFELYEWGKVAYCRPHHLPYSSWDGSVLKSDDILVLWGEQGLGDVLQFLRFVPAAVERAKCQIVLWVPADLVSLVAHSFPECAVMAQHVTGTLSVPWTKQASLLSLPFLLKIAPDEVPANWADPHEINDDMNGKTGLCWAGGPVHRNNNERNLPLELVKELEGKADWVKIGGNDGDELPFDMPVLPRRDFMALAGDLAGMEHVVSVDTSMIHLAGALGKPATLIGTIGGEWRWGLESRGTSNPWYPTTYVIRGRHDGGWRHSMDHLLRLL